MVSDRNVKNTIDRQKNKYSLSRNKLKMKTANWIEKFNVNNQDFFSSEEIIKKN